MLRVSTIVHNSPIEGLGCFAGEDIEQGRLVWVFGETDQVLETKPVDYLTWRHCYRSKHWVLPLDNARFINFSAHPNLREGGLIVNGEATLVAARNILMDEELTVGIETDADAAEKLKEQLP